MDIFVVIYYYYVITTGLEVVNFAPGFFFYGLGLIKEHFRFFLIQKRG